MIYCTASLLLFPLFFILIQDLSFAHVGIQKINFINFSCGAPISYRNVGVWLHVVITAVKIGNYKSFLKFNKSSSSHDFKSFRFNSQMCAKRLNLLGDKGTGTPCHLMVIESW